MPHSSTAASSRLIFIAIFAAAWLGVNACGNSSSMTLPDMVTTGHDTANTAQDVAASDVASDTAGGSPDVGARDFAQADVAVDQARGMDIPVTLDAAADMAQADAAQADVIGMGDGAGVDATFAPANFVFVTSQKFTAATIGGLAGADQKCNTAAANAGLSGTYVAWLSSTTTNAKDRIPTTARGWVRPDQAPVADTLADLLQGIMYHPILVTESGTRGVQGDRVLTGTNADGTLNVGMVGNFTKTTCTDWTAPGAMSEFAASGAPDATFNAWTNTGLSRCSDSVALYCFGTDLNAPLTITPATGRKAFLTQGTFTPGGGLAAADALCASEANGAGLTGTFLAFLATNNASIRSRFNVNGLPWVRTDGVPVNLHPAETFSGTLRAPINVLADGVTYTDFNVYTGATVLNMASTNPSTCNSWTTNLASTQGISGASAFVNAEFFDNTLVPVTTCNMAFPLYCLQE